MLLHINDEIHEYKKETTSMDPYIGNIWCSYWYDNADYNHFLYYIPYIVVLVIQLLLIIIIYLRRVRIKQASNDNKGSDEDDNSNGNNIIVGLIIYQPNKNRETNKYKEKN